VSARPATDVGVGKTRWVLRALFECVGYKLHERMRVIFKAFESESKKHGDNVQYRLILKGKSLVGKRCLVQTSM
jgi:hypothetical protein